MANARVRFIFTEDNMRSPVLYSIACQYRIVPNIQRASITDEGGEIEVLLEGESGSIDDCLIEAERRGVRVERMEDSP